MSSVNEVRLDTHLTPTTNNQPNLGRGKNGYKIWYRTQHVYGFHEDKYYAQLWNKRMNFHQK